MVYKTKGVCSRSIDIELDGDTIKSVKFNGGCNGNTKGIASLVQGMKIDDVIARLKGTDCGGRGTSCPDQLAKALELAKAEIQSLLFQLHEMKGCPIKPVSGLRLNGAAFCVYDLFTPSENRRDSSVPLRFPVSVSLPFLLKQVLPVYLPGRGKVLLHK